MNITQLTAQARPAMTERGQRFITLVLGYSVLLRTLLNFKLKATEHQYRPAAGSQSLAARALSANYTPASMTPAAVLAGTLAAHGFFLKYDQSYKADHDLGIGIEMDQWFNDNLEDKAYDTAMAIEALIIAGSGSGNNMAGLTTILDGSTNVPGLGITMVIDALTGSGLSGDSFDLTASANFDTFLEQLDKWKAEVAGADAIICNHSTAARLATIARIKNSWGQGVDSLGNPVDTINRMSIIPVDDTVLTKTEEDNAGTPNENTSSILVIKNAEGLWNINSNSGLGFYDHGELDGEQQEGIGFEFRAKNEIKRKRAIRRVRNLKV